MTEKGLKVEVNSLSEAGLNMDIHSLAITCGCHYRYRHAV